MISQTSLEDDFYLAWKEYKARKTLESQIVKDADNLAVDLEIKELDSKGSDWNKIWGGHRKALSQQFYTKTAKKIWKELQTANLQNWHLEIFNKGYSKAKKKK